MVTATVPTTQDITGTTAAVESLVECFDCGSYGPCESWQDDTGADVPLCADRVECRRRQFGYCEECIGLNRTCWSCRHPQIVALADSIPTNEDGECYSRSDGLGCGSCRPYRRSTEAPYDF